jgi:cell division protein FtsW
VGRASASRCAWVASRLPQPLIRNLSTWGLIGSMGLLALTLTPLGVTRNHQTNWLGVGPFVIQPSEIAKLAVILWAAHVYANKERRLGELHHILVPVVPGMASLVTGLVLLGATSAPRWCSSRSCSACSGWSAPRRLFAAALS